MIDIPILAAWGLVVGTLKVLMVLSALLLILMVLFQDSKGGGLESAFGGGGVGVSGPGSNRRIIKMTAMMAVVFISLVIVTGLVQRYTEDVGGGVDLTEDKPAATDTDTGTDTDTTAPDGPVDTPDDGGMESVPETPGEGAGTAPTGGDDTPGGN